MAQFVKFATNSDGLAETLVGMASASARGVNFLEMSSKAKGAAMPEGPGPGNAMDAPAHEGVEPAEGRLPLLKGLAGRPT
eukprot:scaffold42043_cov32-Prasinocladus_malaysianus.AAC.1